MVLEKMISILSTRGKLPVSGSISKRINEEMQPFEASIFKIFGKAVFEVSEVKGRSRLNFEILTSEM